jgi:hypothetical protein
VGVVLMTVMGLLLLLGMVVTLWWGGTAYRAWIPASELAGAFPTTGDRPSARAVALQYLRGVAVALVGGFWAGALVTGPAMRLIMRLLAVTAGDDAQGGITEAEEVVGEIELDGTLGLYVFGGILPGLLSGGIYVVLRRLLPDGRLGGVVFGALHLVLAATRIDPLRPENTDFDLVGPGWLSVVTFGVASVVHGMAVVAVANRYSRLFPPAAPDRASLLRAVLPLVLPALLLVPGAFLLVILLLGLLVVVVVSRLGPAVRAVRSRAVLVGGRIAVAILAVALLPATVADLIDVIDRDEPPGVADASGAG